MKSFRLGQRVVVLAEVPCLAPPPSSAAQESLSGMTGTVARLRRADEAAWVRMDCDLPSHLRSFPADDEHGRGNRIILWPQECREVRKPAEKIESLIAERDALKREVISPEGEWVGRKTLAALRKDAERYRWLRNDFSVMGANIDGQHSWAYRRNCTIRGPTLDAAIDTAMGAAPCIGAA